MLPRTADAAGPRAPAPGSTCALRLPAARTVHITHKPAIHLMVASGGNPLGRESKRLSWRNGRIAATAEQKASLATPSDRCHTLRGLAHCVSLLPDSRHVKGDVVRTERAAQAGKPGPDHRRCLGSSDR